MNYAKNLLFFLLFATVSKGMEEDISLREKPKSFPVFVGSDVRAENGCSPRGRNKSLMNHLGREVEKYKGQSIKAALLAANLLVTAHVLYIYPFETLSEWCSPSLLRAAVFAGRAGFALLYESDHLLGSLGISFLAYTPWVMGYV